jgi:hypothetical protein
MTKMSKETQDRLMDVILSLADPTALTLYQAETLIGLLAGEVIEAWIDYGGTADRPKVSLSEGLCRAFLQERELIKRGLVERGPENLLRLTPAGQEMAAVLVHHYGKVCQRLPALTPVAEEVINARLK